MKEEASAMRFEQAQKIKEKVELLEQYQARVPWSIRRSAMWMCSPLWWTLNLAMSIT